MSLLIPKVIVLVDHNPANLEILGGLLVRENYKVVKAQDGQEGLFAARLYKPHAMVIDKELPKLSSYELAECIKSDPLLKSIPLISVVPSSYKFCDLDMYEDCLTKPLSLEYFMTVVRQILGDPEKPLWTEKQKSFLKA